MPMNGSSNKMKTSLQAKIEVNEKPYNVMVDYILSILILHIDCQNIVNFQMMVLYIIFEML